MATRTFIIRTTDRAWIARNGGVDAGKEWLGENGDADAMATWLATVEG